MFQSESSITKQIRFAINRNIAGVMIYAGNNYDLNYYECYLLAALAHKSVLKCFNDLPNRDSLNYNLAEIVDNMITSNLELVPNNV